MTTGTSDSTRFLLSDCEVQPDLNRVVRGAESFAIEPKIMAALVLLARAGGEVVTREELLEKVWDGAWVGDDVVTRAIGELRRVFDDDSRAPRVIETTHLPIKPMTIEEAALELDGAEHGFVVFRDSTSDRLSVLYKRKDRHYGLIAPEL